MEMDTEALNQRCIELFEKSQGQNHYWHVRMFWHTDRHDNPSPRELTDPKVDLLELEVLLSAATGEESQCAEALEAREPGRAALIRHMVQRGEMPLLRRPQGNGSAA